MPAPSIDFWYDFASTYSYVAAMRVTAMAEQAEVAVRWRPFLLGPIFQAQGISNSPFVLFPVKGDYMVRDMQRLCDERGLGFRLPEPFPQHSVLAARVALVGLDDGWGEDFSRALYRIEFEQGMPISEAATIGSVLRGLGKAPDDVMQRSQDDAIKGRLREQTAEAQAKKIFGAPSFTTADGELFWGNDRLEQALAWAKRHAR